MSAAAMEVEPLTMTDTYSDPANLEEFMERVKNAPNLGEIKNIADEAFPSWIVTLLPGFCPDYPHLTENWESICTSAGCPKTEVLIVDGFTFDEHHKLIATLAECFTKCGFAVRRKVEFIPCVNCGVAVPSPALYRTLENSKAPCPMLWSDHCSKCPDVKRSLT